MKIVLSKVYKEARDAAPEAIRWELEDLETELRRNRLTPGHKPEIIHRRSGETLHAYRVTRDWRLITYRWKEDETILLFAGTHDEAYRQAQSVRLEELGVLTDISDSTDVVHAATPELLTTIRNALGEIWEAFSLRFLMPNGEPYNAGSIRVCSSGAKPITDSVDAAFRRALPGILQSEATDLDGRPAVLAAIMENVRKRRESLGLSVREFAERIDYPVESYRQAEDVYIHRGEPRCCTAEYLIPILEALFRLEAEQRSETSVKEETVATRLAELEEAIASLRQTADVLAESLAALREQLA